MYQMKRFIDMEHSLCLPLCFCFYQLGLCSVSYTANEYSIYHFCIIIKDFFISFSRVIIVQDFETVTFYVLFVYKPTFPAIFCWFTEKERNRWRKFFSSSENAIWSILLKYQEIDVQIQAFTDKNWNILRRWFFE